MPIRNALITCGASGLALLAVIQPTSILIGMSILILALFISISPIVAFAILLILSPLRALLLTELPTLPMDIGQIGILILVASYLLNKILFKKQSFLINTSPFMILPTACYLLILGLTGFKAASTGAWLNEWLKWGVIFFMIAMSPQINHRQQWKRVVFMLISAGAAHAIIGLYTFGGGSGALHLLVLNRFFRAFGTFGQPNPFGGFMGLLLPISLMQMYAYAKLIWESFRLKSKLRFYHIGCFSFYTGTTLLLVAGLFASWSRGAWFGFGVSMLVILIALPRRIIYGVLLLSFVILLVFMLWTTGYIPASVENRITSAVEELFVLSDVRAVDITSDNYAIVERLAHWQAASNMFEMHPWFGVGAGNYEVVYNDYRLINWQEPLGHAHNYYLNVLAETGIIGLFGYLTVLLSAIWMTWSIRRHPDLLARCTAIGLLGTWSYLIVHSLTDNLYVNNLFIHLGVIFTVLAALHQEMSRQVKVIIG